MVTEGSGLSAAHKEKSVTARVPGLVHGEFWLAELLAIVEYLEETFPPPEWPRLLPADAQRRARARQNHRLSAAVPCPPLTPRARARARGSARQARDPEPDRERAHAVLLDDGGDALAAQGRAHRREHHVDARHLA
jgi:glutathione S-transferase